MCSCQVRIINNLYSGLGMCLDHRDMTKNIVEVLVKPLTNKQFETNKRTNMFFLILKNKKVEIKKISIKIYMCIVDVYCFILFPF